MTNAHYGITSILMLSRWICLCLFIVSHVGQIKKCQMNGQTIPKYLYIKIRVIIIDILSPWNKTHVSHNKVLEKGN